MRLLSFFHNGRLSFGALAQGGIVDLGARYKDRFAGLRAFLAAGAHLHPEDLPETPDLGLDEIAYALPVPDPSKILCVGVNYALRHEEYQDSRARSEKPNLFLRTPQSFVAHEAPILRPRVSEQLDYEGEIVLVIGRGGRYIDEAQALDHIAGVTIANEGTIRDWLRHSRSNVTQGKNFDASGSIGPWIDTTVHLAPKMAIRTWVNGELRQDDDTSRLIFPFPWLVSYISQFTALHPGDMILTGTPTGAGVRLDPPRFLKPGDELRIEVEGVGTLSNPVREETLD